MREGQWARVDKLFGPPKEKKMYQPTTRDKIAVAIANTALRLATAEYRGILRAIIDQGMGMTPDALMDYRCHPECAACEEEEQELLGTGLQDA